VLERGRNGIETIVRLVILQLLPTIVEVSLLMGVLLWQFDWRYVLATLAMVVVFMSFTYVATTWRIGIRRKMNDSDTDANTKAIDSLLNYETVKYFGAEAREAARYDRSMERYEHASVKTYTSLTLLNAGYHDAAQDWNEWLLRAVAGSPEQIQIMYGIGGERRMIEWEASWLAGYENSRPVRIGNAAHFQLQLDVFGEVMDAAHQARRSGLVTHESGWAVQLALLDHLGRIWQEPDEGIWEVRGGRRQFRIFHQRDVMMGHLAIVVGAVELHRARRAAVAARPDRADLLQADDLGPEPMRFGHVADIDDQMVDADGGNRFGLHGDAPLYLDDRA